MWWMIAFACSGPDPGETALEDTDCILAPVRAAACPEQSEPFTPACYAPEEPCDCPTPADESCLVDFPGTVGAREIASSFKNRPWAKSWVWPNDATTDTRYIVTLHGTDELAQKNFYWWYPRVQRVREEGVDVGILSLQYHDPEAEAGAGYLFVEEIYQALEGALTAEHQAGRAAAEGHVFHGFSRGSANQYGLAILDRENGRWSDTFLADSGAWAPGTEPLPIVQQAIDAGDSSLLSGVRFYIYDGLQDHDPQQNGTYGQNQAAQVVADLGATVERVEDPTGCHSAFLQGEDSDRAWQALLWALAIDQECE